MLSEITGRRAWRLEEPMSLVFPPSAYPPGNLPVTFCASTSPVVPMLPVQLSPVQPPIVHWLRHLPTLPLSLPLPFPLGSPLHIESPTER